MEILRKVWKNYLICDKITNNVCFSVKNQGGMAMAAEINNEHGNIVLSETVIARVAGLAATECYGVVGMAAKSVKDGIVMLLKIDSLTRGVVVRVKENVISVDLHVIMEYGINIPAISETISSTVKYKVQEFTGFNVDVVNIYVEGIRVDEK